MNSSVKYKKFDNSQGNEEKKPQEFRSKSKFLAIVLVIVAVAFVTISVTAVSIGVGVGVSRQSSGLTVIVITREQLQGEYYGSAGGIHFQTTVNSSYVSLFVATEGRKAVLNIRHHVGLSMTLIGAKNTTFLVIENKPGHKKYMDYVIPNSLTNLMQSMMVGQVNMSSDVVQWLDNKTVAQIRQSSLQDLASSQEATLIIEAVIALGEHGIQGTEYPAAMSFYQLALKLARAGKAVASNFTLNKKVNKEPSRQKRGVMCSNVDDVCDRCPFQHDNNDCFGLCGYGCSCWHFVCGDCCVHQFCLTHDQCCADNGFYSWACLSVVWRQVGTSCSESYDC